MEWEYGTAHIVFGKGWISLENPSNLASVEFNPAAFRTVFDEQRVSFLRNPNYPNWAQVVVPAPRPPGSRAWSH